MDGLNALILVQRIIGNKKVVVLCVSAAEKKVLEERLNFLLCCFNNNFANRGQEVFIVMIEHRKAPKEISYAFV